MCKYDNIKRFFALVLTIVMILTVLTQPLFSVSYAINSDQSDNITVSLEVTFQQSEARKIFDMVNELRCGEDAWYWDSGDTKKIIVSGLNALEYDYDLERAAMQRAAEIALSYSHTRPDNRRCFTAYSYMAAGENIAAGYRSASAVNSGWREDNDSYSGQGHRRNMLNKNFTAIGIGCVRYNGILYWVEEFRNPVVSKTETPANNESTKVNINVNQSKLTGFNYHINKESYSFSSQSSQSLPLVTANFYIEESWPYHDLKTVPLVINWVTDNLEIATVDFNMLCAHKNGTTNLCTTIFDHSVQIPISVSGISLYCNLQYNNPFLATKSAQLIFINSSNTYRFETVGGKMMCQDLPYGSYRVYLRLKNSLAVAGGMITLLQESQNYIETTDYDFPMGDVNSDDVIDITDVSILLATENYGMCKAQLDLSGDNLINIADISILLQKNCYGAVSAVIE